MKRTILAAAITAAFATQANATPITTTSDIITTFSDAIGGGVTLSATAEMTNFVFGTDSVTFSMDVTNTTTGATTGSNDRLTSLGWVTQPATSSVTSDSSVYMSLANVSLSSTSLSVCLYSKSNCNGGGNGGLEDPVNYTTSNPDTTGWFTVTIDFATAVPPLDFSGWDAKFQTSVTSYEVTGTSSGCVPGGPIPCGGPPVSVPEPSTLALFGTALVAFGWWSRRRRST